MVDEFFRLADAENITIPIAQSFPDNFGAETSAQLEKLDSAGVRIIFLAAGSEDASHIVQDSIFGD